MSRVIQALRFLNHFSIDVALGAVLSALCFANVLQVELTTPTALLLGLTVWLIYTFDHLEDARGLDKLALSERHRLHQKYFKTLAILLIVGVSMACGLIFLIPTITLLWGVAMVGGVFIYFILLKFLGMHFSYYKELIISLIYGLGVVLGPLSIFEGTLAIWHVVAFVQFIAIAFTNLLLFSVYEDEKDRQQQFPSLVQAIGIERANKLFRMLFFVQLIATLYLFFYSPAFLVPLIFGSMSALLFCVVGMRSFFAEQERYRIVGDGIFLLPALLLL